MSQVWQIFISLEQAFTFSPGVRVDISQEDQHHLQNVLRRKDGDTIRAVCKDSSRLFTALFRTDGETPTIELTEELDPAQEVPPVLSISFASCKGKRNELVCEKATELGVKEIHIWQADHSVAKITDTNKTERYEKIIEGAAKQCKSTHLPGVTLHKKLNDLLEKLKQDQTEARLLCCSLSEDAIPLTEATPLSQPAHIIIGPEGDLSREEEKVLSDFGFQLVSLGPNLLRSETAAITAIAMTQALSMAKS